MEKGTTFVSRHIYYVMMAWTNKGVVKYDGICTNEHALLEDTLLKLDFIGLLCYKGCW